MPEANKDNLLEAVTEIRNWIRVAAHHPVKTLLEATLPDAKSRAAYQMLDGTASMDEVRTKCKMSPNALLALAQRCTALGLMQVNEDKKRSRLFNLADFGLTAAGNAQDARAKR